MRSKVKIGVSVFMTEDGAYGIQSTSQNILTVLGLLQMGSQIIKSKINVDPEEPNNIIVPEGVISR